MDCSPLLIPKKSIVLEKIRCLAVVLGQQNKKEQGAPSPGSHGPIFDVKNVGATSSENPCSISLLFTEEEMKLGEVKWPAKFIQLLGDRTRAPIQRSRTNEF